jgi:hypothetical protein
MWTRLVRLVIGFDLGAYGGFGGAQGTCSPCAGQACARLLGAIYTQSFECTLIPRVPIPS